MMNTEYFYAPPFSFDELKLSIVRNSTSSVYDYTTILFNTAGTAASTDSDDFLSSLMRILVFTASVPITTIYQLMSVLIPVKPLH